MSIFHSPYSTSSGTPHGHFVPSLEQLPDRYWYNPSSRSVVVSALAPSPDADLVLANFVPGLSVSEVLKIYQAQLEDACDPSHQKGSCDTSQKKEKQQQEYNNQKPSLRLDQRYPGVPLRMDNDPNKNMLTGGSVQVSRLPYFLPVQTPKGFRFTTVIATNMAKEGLLHLLIRHGRELVAHGLSHDILSILPQNMRRIVDLLRHQNIREKNTEFMNEMIKMQEADFLNLLKLQDEAWKLLQRFANYMGERINVNGQMQVYSELSRAHVWVRAPSRELYLALRQMTDGRPIRVIITVFLNDRTDYEQKKKDGHITFTQI